MNKYAFNQGMPYCWLPPKILLIMKLIIVMMTTCLMQVTAATFAQKLTYSKKGASLEEIFKEIKKQTGYNVLYSPEKVDDTKKIDVYFKETALPEVLEKVVSGQALEYTINDKNISLKPKEPTFLERLANRWASIDASGRVVDSENLPLPGASVKVKKTGKGVSTDKDGRFFLRGVEEGAVLLVSFIGYLPKEVSASANMGNVVLEQSLSKLDEVQVIAYGTTTQRLSTGNVTTIKADVIEKQPVNNPLLALQGRVPGLFIEQATGFAGTGVKVRIQGTNSLYKGNDPLYVVDGVPFPSQLNLDASNLRPGIQGNSGGDPRISGNPLNFINPADIESIDILKDADATAIYGSRAANGAILITTKKGKLGEVRINLDMQTGIGNVGNKLKMLNTSQYLEMRREALKNDNIMSPNSFDYDINGSWDTTRNVDWQKKLIGGNAIYQDLQASISGGSNITTFLVGTNYHRETNVFTGDFADTKGSAHVNINSSSANQKFKIQFLGSYMLDNNELPTVDLTRAAITLSPNAPEPYNSDGSLNWQPTELGATTYPWNPLAPFKNNYRNKTNTLTSNVLLSYQILPGLNIKSSFGATELKSDQTVIYPVSSQQPENLIYAKGYSYFSKNGTNSWLIEPQLNYSLRINKGKLEVLLGATMQRNSDNSLGISGSNYNSDLLLNDLKSASNILIEQSINSVYKYSALYGRVNYNWIDKYILNLTARRDGSSNFGPENQFHNFAAVGAAWIFSQENFSKDFFPVLSQGKLRMSYGTTGNDQIGSYQFLDLYESIPAEVPYQGGLGLKPNRLNNPYLQWEETRKFQIGLDLGLFKDRIIFNANYNRNTSSNQLSSLPLPIITGGTGVAYNIPAIIQNTGWEFSLITTNISSRDIRWTTNFNITIPKNKLVSYKEGGLASNNYFVIGEPISVQHIFQFAGVNQQTGLYQFINKEGNTTSELSDPEDRIFLINTDPKFYGGFQNSVNYKAFSVDVMLQFVKQIGNDETKLLGGNSLAGKFGVGPNIPVYQLDRWRKSGDQTVYQMFATQGSAYVSSDYASRSSFVYADASYIRLKNISISWTLPEKLKDTFHAKNVKLFIQGQNLLTITSYKGLDPETKGLGLPPLRTITIGAKIIL